MHEHMQYMVQLVAIESKKGVIGPRLISSEQGAISS
jgi:hypothetical protein